MSRRHGKNQISIAKTALDACHRLAEEKNHTIVIPEGYMVDTDILGAQIRLFLCRKYGYSAATAEQLVQDYLTYEKEEVSRTEFRENTLD
jgi:hypothetical protein